MAGHILVIFSKRRRAGRRTRRWRSRRKRRRRRRRRKRRRRRRRIRMSIRRRSEARPPPSRCKGKWTVLLVGVACSNPVCVGLVFDIYMDGVEFIGKVKMRDAVG